MKNYFIELEIDLFFFNFQLKTKHFYYEMKIKISEINAEVKLVCSWPGTAVLCVVTQVD